MIGESTLERVRVPLRRVHGAHATVVVEAIGGDVWRAAWSTGAPGWGSRSTVVDQAVGYLGRQVAIDRAVLEMREYWRRLDVPAMVASLQDWLDEWR